MITNLKELLATAAERPAKRLVAAWANDPHTVKACADAVARGIVTATLVGDKTVIEDVCRAEKIDPTTFDIVDEKSDTGAVAAAVSSVASGEGDILMKGLISTDKYMRGILSKEMGLVPPKGILSHVSVIDLPSMDRLLVVSDVAVIPAPDLDAKKAMIGYCAAVAAKLGCDAPRVALIAPSEQVLPAIASSAEAAILSKMGDRRQLPGGCVVDGPLALDVAIDPESARIKGLTGPVAGNADCLVFPNIESANVFFKSCTKLAGAEIAAVVTGAKVPCVLTSRGDSETTKLCSIALAALMA